jgi:hypothetical protein
MPPFHYTTKYFQNYLREAAAEVAGIAVEASGLIIDG